MKTLISSTIFWQTVTSYQFVHLSFYEKQDDMKRFGSNIYLISPDVRKKEEHYDEHNPNDERLFTETRRLL